jgi:hypothetical protein
LKRRHFRVNPQQEAHIHETARDLLVHYGVSEGLRALDSLQLAAAIEFTRAHLASTFVTADQPVAAALVGCPVLAPKRPASPFQLTPHRNYLYPFNPRRTASPAPPSSAPPGPTTPP